MLKVARRQAEQVLEHLQAEHGVDAISRVQDQVLAYPGHGGGEGHEHRQADANHRQGIERVMDHDLVDDHLREQRRCQRHQLDGERGQEDIAEHLAVLQQLGNEPAKAEGFARRSLRIGVG